jgi:hypothetical protein
MTEKLPSLEALLADVVRVVIREELAGIANVAKSELLTPEALAEKLKVPLSWVYEQSRQGNIPTQRLGRYIRFNLLEVIESQRKKSV